MNAIDHSGDCLTLAPMRGLTGQVYRNVFARRFGDINSVADLKRLYGRFPSVSRWMIGRGLLVDPFLALAIRGDHVAGEGDVARVRSFLDELYDCYREQLSGPGPVLGKMKELWSYQSQLFVDGSRHMKKIQRVQTLAQYERAVDAFFARCEIDVESCAVRSLAEW